MAYSRDGRVCSVPSEVPSAGSAVGRNRSREALRAMGDYDTQMSALRPPEAPGSEGK